MHSQDGQTGGSDDVPREALELYERKGHVADTFTARGTLEEFRRADADRLLTSGIVDPTFGQT